MFRIALVLLLVASLPVRANLGETVAECVKRYGKPVGFSEASAKFPFGTIVFAAGSYTLIVFLHDDKEVGARVSKKDSSAFAAGELKTIMDADTVGAGWTPENSPDAKCDRWTRGDKATALYDHANHMIIFTSDEMTRLAKAAPASTKATPAPAPGAQ